MCPCYEGYVESCASVSAIFFPMVLPMYFLLEIGQSGFFLLFAGYVRMGVGCWKWFLVMAPFFLLDKLAEVADSPRLMSLHKNRRLITELEALGQRVDALRSLDCLREIVARDSGTLEVLEQLLDRAHVGMRLKNGYVDEMEQSE
ncbi:hypothetical protein Tco_1413394 [Tanacetum coccineum]